MFKKKAQIKNLSPLRSSDRRKLADQIISDFNISVPPARPELSVDDQHGTDLPAEPSLASVRNSLLPENCSSARFTTHAGTNNKLVSGTLYVASYLGQEERILWLRWDATPQRLYPTVYTLWANPGLVPLLHTPAAVIDKLKTGAHLMTAGLVGGPPWPASAKKDAVVAAASTERPSVPVWVGVCEIDVSALANVHGVKGKAVEGLHWAGDQVWSWSLSRGDVSSGGREVPQSLQGWGHELAEEALATDIANLDLADENEDAQYDGDVPIGEAIDEQHSSNRDGINGAATEPWGEEQEPTTQEIDDAFQQAFLYSLYDAKKNGEPPHYGLDLPGIQPSYMVEKMIQPYLKTQSPHYTIRKTSWKNTKKFIKHLDKQKIIKSKDRNGGETIILDIDFDNTQIQEFIHYKLTKPQSDSQSRTNANGTDLPVSQQGFTIQYLYRASSKLVPDLLPSTTDYYTRAEVSDYIHSYVENNQDLSVGVSSRRLRRFIKLNPFIANNILGSNQAILDTEIFAKGEIARDVLQKRVLNDDQLCIPFWVLLRSDQVCDPSDRSLPKPRPGSPPKVTITIEKRSGSKTITTVTGLETFYINPHTIGPELQKKCASSASVQQAHGLKPGMMEVMVQGDQRNPVISEVVKRGIEKDWLEIVDKTKKKGK